VSLVILLDSGPLGLATNPNTNPVNQACLRWVLQQAKAGSTIVIPEIIDFELRRELLRAKKTQGLERLEQFSSRFLYLPINTNAMRLAAQAWAEARQQGKPTAPDLALDADMILVGQYLSLAAENAIIATTNPKHLVDFAKAVLWTEI
jgi:predicted nucleic acid-binding protein